MTYSSRRLTHPIADWRELLDRRDPEQRVWHLFETVRRGRQESCSRVCGAPAYEVVQVGPQLICAACFDLLRVHGD